MKFVLKSQTGAFLKNVNPVTGDTGVATADINEASVLDARSLMRLGIVAHKDRSADILVQGFTPIPVTVETRTVITRVREA